MGSKFWKGKRVLITGHTGFKGGWLAMWLNRAGARLAGFALPPSTRPSFFADVRLESRLESHYGDIRNLTAITSVVRGFRPQIVFHMAAQPLVLASYQDPVRTYAVNAMGTVHLLEACRRVEGLRVIVNVTTDKVYANQERSHAYVETDPLGGFDPYSSSKTCSEFITSAYASSFFLSELPSSGRVAVATARSGNVVGGGDWARDRLIPDIVRAFQQGRKVRIRHPDAIRPWQHVLEPLHAYMLLAERLWRAGSRYGGAWNFGPSSRHECTVAQMVRLFAEHWGRGASDWIADRKIYPHETLILRLSSKRATRQLGWQASLGVKATVQLVVDWYRARAEGSPMDAVTLAQIEAFEQHVA